MPKARSTITPAPLDPEVEVKAIALKINHLRPSLILSPQTPDQASQARVQFNRLKDIEKDLKAHKEAITKPLNKALGAVRDLFRPRETELGEAIEEVKDGLLEFDARAREEMRKKTERLEERVEAGEVSEGFASKQLAKASDRVGEGVVNTQTRKGYEITDESKIPDPYWVLDLVKLRRDVLGGVEVPGTRVVDVPIVVKG